MLDKLKTSINVSKRRDKFVHTVTRVTARIYVMDFQEHS